MTSTISCRRRWQIIQADSLIALLKLEPASIDTVNESVDWLGNTYGHFSR
jgi:hypothetical protein